LSKLKAKTKKKSGEFDAFRKRLEDHRQEILDMYQHDLRVGQESSDEGAEDLVDRANNAYNREFMLSLSGSERQILLEIQQALDRLEEGTYGHCVHCGEVIPRKRLQAVPWARYCIDCQEQVEQGVLLES
jgi:RNA polymerase-binding transcription factor